MIEQSSIESQERQQTAHLYERIAQLEGEIARLRSCLDNQRDNCGECDHWHEVLHVFFTISEEVPKGVTIANLDGKLLYANRAYYAMTGYAASLVGTHISALYDEDPSYLLHALRQVAEQSFWEGVLSGKRHDGSTFKALLSAFALRDSSGDPRAVGIVMRDISTGVQAEEHLRRAHAEIENRVRERTDELSRINNALHAEIVERIRTEEALRQSEERYERAVKAARVGVWDWDLQTNEIYLAPNLKALLGYADDEIPNHMDHWSRHVHPDDMHQVMAAAYAHMRGETPRYEAEHRMLHKDGSTRWFIVRGVVVRDAVGHPVRMAGTDTDITDRKQTEEGYQNLVNHSLQGLVIYQVPRLVFANPTMETITGYTVDELLNLHIRDIQNLIHRDDRARVCGIIRQCLEGAPMTPRCQDIRITHQDGAVRWLEKFAILTSYRGKPAIQATFIDITERKRTEEALNQSYAQLEVLNTQIRRHRDLLRTLFDGLEDGLLLLDHEGHVMIANQSLATLLGTTPKNLVGACWHLVCQRATPPFPSDLVRHTLHDGRGHQHRARITDSSGQVRIFDMQTLPLLGPDERIDRVILHVADVTRNLQLQARVIENERFVASGRLAASVAHEINTPLQSIQNALDLLRVLSEEEREEFLSSALGEIQRIGKIVRQLLDLYRPGTLTPGPVDVTTLIERILLLMGKQIKEQHIIVERMVVPDPPLLWGRADELSQVLLNLLVNALDAMPHGGTLRVETRIEEHPPPHGSPVQMFVVAIRDTGTGINPEIARQIFEPFVTTKENGTGLGLSISSQIIEHHGGTIGVESQPGQGSTFTISLPLRDRASEMGAPERSEP